MIENRQKKIYKACIGLSIIFFVSIIFFINFFSQLRDIAGAGLMLSLLFFFTSLICILIFKKRSDALDYAIKNRKFITKWSFSKKEWQKFQKIDFLKKKIENAAKFKALSAITLIIFIVFIFMIDEAKLEMAIVMISLIIFYYLLAFIFPLIIFSVKKNQDTEILFMNKGVLINKVYHTWNFPFSKLRNIQLKKDPIYYLEISYSFVDRLGPREYNLRLPIPNKKKAQKIIKDLKKSNNL